MITCPPYPYPPINYKPIWIVLIITNHQMQKEEPEPNTVTIQLKHMELTPEQLAFSEPTRVLLKISRSNSSMIS